MTRIGLGRVWTAWSLSAVALLSTILASCSTTEPGLVPAPGRTTAATTSPTPTAPAGDTASAPPTASATTTSQPGSPEPSTSPVAPGSGGATPAPSWLGTRVLRLRADGSGVARATPPELVDRRIATVDLLPPPADGGWHSTLARVPPDVVRRSTWSTVCPVSLADLRYLTVSFWGFDAKAHTGELLVHRDVAAAAVEAFRLIFRAHFPIEQMRVVSVADVEAPPTGDGDLTSAFVCRRTRGQTTWSEHAYGRAVDVDPFQNPYVKGSVLLPELAGAYTDRSSRRPGMILPGGPVDSAFRSVGWFWGGRFHGLKDWMHFSSTGR